MREYRASTRAYSRGEGGDEERDEGLATRNPEVPDCDKMRGMQSGKLKETHHRKRVA